MQFAFAKSKSTSSKNISISVIVCAKNEAENLKKFLPSIINQDYEKFEVVLINDASSDDTLDVMKTFEEQHNNIKIVDVENNEAFWGNKKYALTLGIKAASHNFLLFTDADCKPVSNQWIKEMSSQFNNEKTVVIGYGAYKKKKFNLLNALIRFETIFTAIQYFSYTKIGMPYMAVGRNLAYRREEFFNANGFMSHMQIRSGDDDLFVNQVANKSNTALCFSKDSFTESIPETNFKNWFNQKRRHISTANHYKPIHKTVLGLFYISQLLFWITSIILLVLLFRWEIVVSLIAFRFVLQYISFGLSAKKLDDTKLIYTLPFLELFLIVSQFFIFISNLTSKTHHWR
ncbi:glycosyltransferase [Pontimicrobium sp. IMCC45349]|uniref:glycosyltransferase n=1 Tax=Pontimicrobium sp. IMCC45349 TaxID=3391574 RepID=UPI00399F4506